MIEDRELAIVERLNGAVDNADCKPFPRNPESYRHLGGPRFYSAFLRGWLRGLGHWQRTRNLLD